MKEIESKYNQGTLKSKWKIQQCQGEKIHFGIEKDCENCSSKDYCFENKFQPFSIKVDSRVWVFADTFENAKKYVDNGHGWVIKNEIVGGFPIKIQVEGVSISAEPDLNSKIT